jgi:hypothetical protein
MQRGGVHRLVQPEKLCAARDLIRVWRRIGEVHRGSRAFDWSQQQHATNQASH